MAIPYLLINRIGETGTHLRHHPQHYDRAGIQVINHHVKAVDTASRRLTLESGSLLHYDRLLVATGSRPVLPPVEGADLPGVHTCWTLADARQIMRLAQPGARVVLIGAGFIGCIILESLAERGVEMTVVEVGDRMVPRMLNRTAGTLLKRWCETKGVRVFTSTRVTAIDMAPTDKGLKVRLDSGQELAADLVVSAAGVAPNIDFLQGSGVEIERGILIDPQMRTTIPDIYAAGDVAQGRDFSTGGFDVHAIQPTASEHGRCAALNMAGVATPYQGSLNMNVLDTLGLISSSFGLWMGVDGGDTAEACEPEQFRYLSLQFQDDVMVGATGIGLTQHVGVLRGLIQGRVRLGDWKQKLLRDPSRVMEAYLAQNYSAQHRA
jgi:NAD(P)H-nitrite reductase large subunit